jgi:hypothetical protein
MVRQGTLGDKAMCENAMVRAQELADGYEYRDALRREAVEAHAPEWLEETIKYRDLDELYNALGEDLPAILFKAGECTSDEEPFSKTLYDVIWDNHFEQVIEYVEGIFDDVLADQVDYGYDY